MDSPPKEIPRTPRGAPRRPPRGLQDAPRSFEDVSRKPAEAPKIKETARQSVTASGGHHTNQRNTLYMHPLLGCYGLGSHVHLSSKRPPHREAQEGQIISLFVFGGGGGAPCAVWLSWVPDAPRRGPRDPKGRSKRPQRIAPRRPKRPRRPPRRPKRPRVCSQKALKEPQEGPKTAQEGPRMAGDASTKRHSVKRTTREPA